MKCLSLTLTAILRPDQVQKHSHSNVKLTAKNKTRRLDEEITWMQRLDTILSMQLMCRSTRDGNHEFRAVLTSILKIRFNSREAIEKCQGKFPFVFILYKIEISIFLVAHLRKVVFIY